MWILSEKPKESLRIGIAGQQQEGNVKVDLIEIN
jgi:hypothetical protein